ncbi:MAG: hypothetical protein MRK02_08815 [Candidatus Scalindua sp.]|nr:hypothetical protein [Candidatus Scalindua sp.]
MGSKQTGERKYLFLYITCIVMMLFGIQGCIHFPEKQQDEQLFVEVKPPLNMESNKDADVASEQDHAEVLNMFPQFAKKWEGRQKLAKARVLMLNGYHKSSLKNNKDVLESFPHILGDQALFQMGLNYAHPGNPKNNYKRSKDCFQRILKEYPESDIRDQAAIWVLFLQEIMSKNKEIMDKNRRINNLQIQVEELQYQIESLKKIDLGIEEKKRESLLK